MADPLHKKPIIAVFGTSDPKHNSYEQSCKLATEIGAALAGQAIVLTGAIGPEDRGVKGAAIKGVGRSAWIGIDQSGEVAFNEIGNGCRISTDLGNKRNLLEAHVCDAAICLPGGKGTVSEGVFALSQQRPVAFVGPNWPGMVLRDGIAAMIKQAIQCVGTETTWRFIDEQIDEQRIANKILRPPQSISFFGLDDRATNIVSRLLRILGEDRPGSFPPMEVKRYESVREGFVNWLKAGALGNPESERSTKPWWRFW